MPELATTNSWVQGVDEVQALEMLGAERLVYGVIGQTLFTVRLDATLVPPKVGDIVAMVVADTALQARDAAELISVTWEDLPAVTDMEAALRPDVPLVFTGAPGNVAYDTHIGDKQETDKAFAGAAAEASCSSGVIAA